MLGLIHLWSISEHEDVVNLPSAHRGAEYTFQGNPGYSYQNGGTGAPMVFVSNSSFPVSDFYNTYRQV